MVTHYTLYGLFFKKSVIIQIINQNDVIMKAQSEHFIINLHYCMHNIIILPPKSSLQSKTIEGKTEGLQKNWIM